MTDLKRVLGEAVETAFAAIGAPPELGRVTPSDRPDLADFQSNGALAAAKRLGKNPREIAAAVADRLAGDPRLAGIEIAGMPASDIGTVNRSLRYIVHGCSVFSPRPNATEGEVGVITKSTSAKAASKSRTIIVLTRWARP